MRLKLSLSLPTVSEILRSIIFVKKESEQVSTFRLPVTRFLNIFLVLLLLVIVWDSAFILECYIPSTPRRCGTDKFNELHCPWPPQDEVKRIARGRDREQGAVLLFIVSLRFRSIDLCTTKERDEAQRAKNERTS